MERSSALNCWKNEIRENECYLVSRNHFYTTQSMLSIFFNQDEIPLKIFFYKSTFSSQLSAMLKCHFASLTTVCLKVRICVNYSRFESGLLLLFCRIDQEICFELVFPKNVRSYTQSFTNMTAFINIMR